MFIIVAIDLPDIPARSSDHTIRSCAIFSRGDNVLITRFVISVICTTIMEAIIIAMCLSTCNDFCTLLVNIYFMDDSNMEAPEVVADEAAAPEVVDDTTAPEGGDAVVAE